MNEIPEETQSGGRGWLFVEPDAVPERWRKRGIQVVLVPLLPDELSDMLSNQQREADPDDDLLTLIADGLRVDEIANRLGVSPRTVRRRLVVLRRRFGVETVGEIANLLVRRGF